MATTGVILAYERQITRWANREYRVAGNADQQRLPIGELLAKVKAAQGTAPSAVTLRPNADAPVEFSFGRDRILFINSFNGESIGESHKLPVFFSKVEDTHRWLGAGQEKRQTWRAVTGACNFAFFILVVTGPFIWWPKDWNWTNLKKIALFRGGLSGRARYWNWHNVLGAWCVAPLFIIALTVVIMSYAWANNLLYRVTGNDPSSPPQAASSQPRSRVEGKSHQDSGEKKPEFDGIEQIVTTAKQQVPQWRTITIRMPSGRGPLSVTVDQSNGGRPDLRSQFTIDLRSNEIRQETFSSYNGGRRLRAWARFSHTGEAAGILGQTIAAMVSASVSLLVFTGILLSVKRLLTWRSRTT